MRTLFEILKSHSKLLLGMGTRKSYSQFGEDIFVWHLLRKKKGVYVDVGAYHPILYSNTYSFYKSGWRGVVIDPNPLCEELFRWFRPEDTFINAAVGAKSGEGAYYQYSDGAYNSLNPTLHGNKNIKLLKKTSVPIKPLSELLREVEHIDFMNIDAEGMDTEVLTSHNWAVKPTVVAVEGNLGGETHEFLLDKGYVLKAVVGMTMIFESRS